MSLLSTLLTIVIVVVLLYLLLTASLTITSLLMVLLVAVVIYVMVALLSKAGGLEGFEGFEGEGFANCKEMCFAAHPEAARMYADQDNDVATTVIDQCVSGCESMIPPERSRRPDHVPSQARCGACA